MSAHTPKTLTCGCHTPNRYANGEMLFEFCSLHAAAPALLNLAHMVVNGATQAALLHEARAAIAAAKGESNG